MYRVGSPLRVASDGLRREVGGVMSEGCSGGCMGVLYLTSVSAVRATGKGWPMDNRSVRDTQCAEDNQIDLCVATVRAAAEVVSASTSSGNTGMPPYLSSSAPS